MSSENGLPGGLPLFSSGWGAGNIQFNEADDFWSEATRVAAEGVLAESLDAAMSGKSSPRVWVILHEPGESHLSAGAALSLSCELGRRDQAVLLLDGDDEAADLTRWAGRLEKDGWIDLVRYGSSVLASGMAMPFEGRRGYLLGVGSFTPADVTGPEVEELLGRLKRQADDILICAPAGAVGRLWAAQADVRLLCWDRSRLADTLVGDLVENYRTAGLELTGLVGYGLPDAAAMDHVVDEVIIAADSRPEPEHSPKELSEEPARGAAAEVLEQLEEADEEVVLEGEEFARRKGNSGIFWMAAVVAVLMISMASVYYFKFVKVPSGGHFAEVTQNGTAPQTEVSQAGVAGFDSGLAAMQEDTVTDGLPADEQATNRDTEEPGETLTGELTSANDQDPDLAAAVAESGAAGEKIPPTIPAEVDKPLAEEPAEQDQALAMDPFTVPVGTDGWALHVYSFPDSALAHRESARLAAKGFQSTTRAIQIKDKGRWWRLYLGSFKTRAEANEARTKLMEELHEDWANPVRF